MSETTLGTIANKVSQVPALVELTVCVSVCVCVCVYVCVCMCVCEEWGCEMHLQIRHSSQQRLLSLNFSSLSCASGFLSPSPSLLLPTGGKVQAPASCPWAQEVPDAKPGCTESEGL